jgi:hypothetical protein
MDDVQYIRHGWINRNRILSPNNGTQYLTVPICKHSSGTKIKMIRAVEGSQWKKSMVGQLTHYKKKAPYYGEVFKILDACFAINETSITKLNGHYFEIVCSYLGINYKMEIASSLNLDYSDIEETQDWAIEISKQLGASEYYNPPGGQALYNKAEFAGRGIELKLVSPELKPYQQINGDFIPGLSILDVMMFNSPEMIRSMLNDFIYL